ncbi:UNVERIFIED_ORG: hypothetical protein ABIC97_005021, partial [Peribacillus simplex]
MSYMLKLRKFNNHEKPKAKAFGSVCRQKGFGIIKFRTPFEIPFEFWSKVKILG